MGQPSLSDVHVNKPLTNILVAYMQQQKDFIADQVFPVVPVAKKSDVYFTFPKGEWYRDTAEKRAPGTESAGGGFNVSTDSYNCEIYAKHKNVDDQTRSNQDSPLDLDAAATRFVGQKILLKREVDFVANYFSTGIWSGAADYTPGTLWDASSSTPVENVDSKKEEVRLKHGYMPNRLIVTSDVHSVLKSHPDILDRIKYTQRGIVTEDLLAEVFGVEKYLVARGIKNTAAEGASDSMAGIFGSKDCLLAYAANKPSLYEPSAGYTFAWSQFSGAKAGARTKKFRIETHSSDRIEAEAAWDMKLVAADMGCFFSNVIS